MRRIVWVSSCPSRSPGSFHWALVLREGPGRLCPGSGGGMPPGREKAGLTQHSKNKDHGIQSSPLGQLGPMGFFFLWHFGVSTKNNKAMKHKRIPSQGLIKPITCSFAQGSKYLENSFTTPKPFNNLLTLGITLSCMTYIWEGPSGVQRPPSHSPYPPGAHSSERREENRSSYSRGQWNHRWAGREKTGSAGNEGGNGG